MGALGAQVAVHRVQRSPQLASGLALEGGQECVNAIDADLRVLGLAVPDAPAQSLDLRDDHRLRRPSRCRSPSSQLRMKVESKLTTIAFASTLTGASAADVIARVLAILKVWRRNVSGSWPASTGNICPSRAAAVR